MRHDPDTHHRHSIRLPGYDYAQDGAYFLTLCAHNRDCLFGEIVGDSVQLNGCGEIVREEWLRTPVVRPNVTLDEFVVMPNHMHMIVVLEGALRANSGRQGEAPLRPYDRPGGYGSRFGGRHFAEFQIGRD